MFSCQFCGRTFTTKHAHAQHEKYHCKLNPDRQKINRDTFYTEHKKTACRICGKLFDVANIKKHEASCSKPKKESVYHVVHDGLNCIFCGKLCKHKNSLAQHELRCKENPERKSFNCLADYVVSETAEAKRLRYDNCQSTLRARIAAGDVCYDNTVRSGYKFGTYKGYHCDSSWELAFVLYNLDHGVTFSRNTLCFPYEFNGVVHNYYPDFIVDNVYYEIKSYIDDRVQSKCRDFPSDKTLIILDQNKMQKYLSYCEDTYGKNFAELYDRSSPSWMDLI